MGRDAILDAAADLLAEADLATVTASFGIRAVAAAAGVAPSSVSHHFSSASGPPTDALGAATVRHALDRQGYPLSERTVEELMAAAEDIRRGDEQALGRIVNAAAADLLAFSSVAGRSADTATYLALAAAPCDPTARDILTDYYGKLEVLFTGAYELLADATGRRFVAEISAVDLSRALTALADGFLIRRRFDPDHASPALFASLAVRIFEACTVDQAALEDPRPVDNLLRLPPDSHLDPHKREAIADAAATIYQRRNQFTDVTIGAVAEIANVNRATITANFGGRRGLAAAIWATFVPALADGLARDATDKPIERVVWHHLQRLVERARFNHDLTTAFLEGVFAYTSSAGAPGYDDPRDPRTLVPLPKLLEAELWRNRGAFRPGFVDPRPEALGFAAFVTNSALHLAITRPQLLPGAVADYVSETVLAGVLAAPSERSR